MMCDTPFFVLPKARTEKVPVPCGKCPPCKMRRVNGWVFRMLQEDKRQEFSHFVTFTYDTRCVPISDNGFMTLRKQDFQRFMKRLRKLCVGSSVKYYAVGEYGTNNGRPHYHAVVFGVPDPQFFSDAWPFGSVHVGSVSGDSIAYTMKYIDKPSFVRKHGRDDREPEFPLMSKRLGDNYLTDEMVGYHKADLSRMYVVKEGGYRVGIPRYYRDKIYSDEDRRLQVAIAQHVADSSLEKDLAEFKSLYGHFSDIDFSSWQESKKYGRYQSFYSNQKNRDL